MPRGTPVVATAAGVIKESKRSDLQAGYGNYIDIDHGNNIITRYAHLEDITIRYGNKVEKGDVIGTVGSSGGSIAPHLHYEILRDGKNVDPIYYIIEGMTSDQHEQLTWLSHQQNQSLD
jgi:murein DD-endopeptidase MepM/ murein hydrolase activator NlpD